MATGQTNKLLYKRYFYNLMLFYKNRQDVKMFLEILLSLTTVCIFIIFAIRPTLVTIAKLTTDISSKQQIVAQMDQKIRNLSEAQNVYNLNRETIDLLDISIPNRATVQSYIRQAEALSRQQNVNLESLNLNNIVLAGNESVVVQEVIDEEEALKNAFPEGASEVKMVISVSGNFSSLLSFLKQIEQTIRPLKIDGVSFNTLTQENISQRVVLTITGRLPFIQEP